MVSKANTEGLSTEASPTTGDALQARLSERAETPANATEDTIQNTIIVPRMSRIHKYRTGNCFTESANRKERHKRQRF